MNNNDNAQLSTLVKKAQRGDGEAFLALMGGMKAQLYPTALAYLHRPDAALQAIEDASCAAWLKIRQLRKPEFARTWVTRILINVCIRQLRRDKRHVPLESLPAQHSGDETAAFDLRDAVHRLPDDLRAVVSVRYFGGLTVPETANALNWPEGTVKTRLRKALSLLRLELEV